jgi:hypothetical protein
MKVAVCFWGLSRSLQYTLPSIEECIFQPLRNVGIEISIFLHTYTLYRPYTNPRAGETGIQLKNTVWKSLQPTASIVENQDRVDLQLQLENYRTHGDPWGNESTANIIPFETLNNHIRALWSLHQVTTLWEQSGQEFDCIIYARPDVEYRRPLNIQWLHDCKEGICMIPNFHLTHNCNDRFTIGKPSVMKLYGHRFHDALAFSKQSQLHSEKYLSQVLSFHNIQFEYIHFPFRRIRADGTVAPADQDL